MGHYRKPEKRVHRGFVYLDDETVINSLSAVEAGKIDEVVAKVNTAREGGLTGGLGLQGVKLEGGRKGSTGFEEEMVRTRTRFSVFELWYQNLIESKALGTFDGWGADVVDDVRSGDTVEFRADCEVAPIQTLFRLFLWFADKAKTSGTVFSQKGDDLKETKEAERAIRLFLGDQESDDEDIIVTALPKGGPGPKVAMSIRKQWLIGALGQLGGEYTVIAQVDRVLGSGEELPALRLTNEVAPTPLETKTLAEALTAFVEPAAEMGVPLTGDEHAITGPAIWLQPIAIFR